MPTVVLGSEVKGTIQYVTTGADGKIRSELLPASAKVDDQYICAADGLVYKVAVVATSTALAELTLVGPVKSVIKDPWDINHVSTDNSDPIDSGTGRPSYPDASYFAVGPVTINTKASYVWIDDKGKVRVKDASLYVPVSSYPALGANGLTPKKAGDTPSSTVSALYASQAPVGVVHAAQDAMTDARCTELLKFMNILDKDGKLTALGASIDSRLVANAADEANSTVAGVQNTQVVASPTPGGTSVTYTAPDGTKVYSDNATGAWTGGATTWAHGGTADKAQFVALETGTNQSVGFVPGRAKYTPPTGMAEDQAEDQAPEPAPKR